MNKYTKLSNFEINELISINLGFIHTKSFDPCNNPSDAMPIVFENRINLRTVDGYMDYTADHPTNSRIYSHNINPLRAAMEVYLLMKDAENEG